MTQSSYAQSATQTHVSQQASLSSLPCALIPQAFAQTIHELAARVIQKATARGIQIATAESCTGGLVASALTSISGASAVVRGGVVSYALEVKQKVLGVSEKLLQEQGAVCGDCAQQMASGAQKVLDADLAVAITGIAGPTGVEPHKPVGTVWFAVACTADKVDVGADADNDASDNSNVKDADSKRQSAPNIVCFVRNFSGTRDEIRAQSTIAALKAVLEALS